MRTHPTTLRRTLAAAVAGSLILGLAACGDDSASTMPATETTPPADELTISGA